MELGRIYDTYLLFWGGVGLGYLILEIGWDYWDCVIGTASTGLAYDGISIGLHWVGLYH